MNIVLRHSSIRRAAIAIAPFLIVFVALLMLLTIAQAAPNAAYRQDTSSNLQGGVRINEIRIDQPSTDVDEYFELVGDPLSSLDGLFYIVIGDGAGGSGVIENVTNLTGTVIPSDGYFLAAEDTMTLAAPDLETSLNFENSDNVTHLLVSGFTGATDDDLDINDDGILDVMPWSEIVDLIALIEEENPPSATEYHYGPPTVGPDGSFVPGHAIYCETSSWEIGGFDPLDGDDTPGKPNATCPLTINELRIDQPGTDNDEYFELQGTAGVTLTQYTYLVIGDGTGGSGTIEAAVALTGTVIPADNHFLAVESTSMYTPSADLVLVGGELNFENSDNVTHMLVSDFNGAIDDDLDIDDDGVLDLMPWSAEIDCLALIETPGSGDLTYCSDMVGPDGTFVPGHAYFCNASGWEIGLFDIVGGDDTPGDPNFSCALTINELRIDQSGTDNDEYFELYGSAGIPLSQYTYLVIGDGPGGSGTVEAVVPLAGSQVPLDSYFLAVESTSMYSQTADLVLQSNALNFENSDNVTHMLVSDFSGALDDDLDIDDDGVLDVTPWSSLDDCVALIETPGSGDLTYCPVMVGPDGSFVPGHVYYCETAGWQIGPFDIVGGDDTPGAFNSACPAASSGLFKQAPGVVGQGETFSYTLTISNELGLALTGVVLTDVVPLNSSFAGASDNGTLVGDTVLWNLGDLPSGSGISVQFAVTATTLLTDIVNDNYAFAASNYITPTFGPPVTTTVALQLRIHDIQGAGHFSAYDGSNVVNVPGIVTALFYNGFYLQDPSPDTDDDTSEAIFVYTGGAPTVSVGDEIRVNGGVSEYYPGGIGTGNLSTTELNASEITVLSSGNALPAATVVGTGGRIPPSMIIDNDSTGDVNNTPNFDPEEDGIDFYESLEGMLLQVNDPVIVGSNQFGEIGIVGDNGDNASVFTPRGGLVIRSDDFNPERILIDDSIISNPPDVSVGDSFTDIITGVLDYTFGNFKLFNVNELPLVATGGLTRETTTLVGTPDQLSIATFNVLNLDPNPADGDDDTVQFQELAAEIVNNLQSPDIIGLQEIQDNSGVVNDGTVDASLTYGTLITEIVAAGGPMYDFRDISPLDGVDGGVPGGNIRVGFLFRPDRVSFVDRPGGDATTATTVDVGPTGVELSFSPGRIDPTNTAFDDSRKPLAGEFLFNGYKLFVVTNHFNSKGGDDPLFGRLQPPNFPSEIQRAAQAQVVNDFVDSILALDPGANVIVVGDLNDFQFSMPISVLSADVLNNLIDTLPLEEQYTYIYDSNSQVLDHILLSDNLFDNALPEADVVHVNSEFDTDLRPSDHDPVVAVVTLTELVAGFSSNSPINIGEPAVFTNTTSGAAPLAFQWDFGDGSGVVTDVNPIHLYELAGSYTVVLTATNASGVDVFTDTFEVSETTIFLPYIARPESSESAVITSGMFASAVSIAALYLRSRHPFGRE